MPWRAFWTSRLLVWAAGIAGVLVSGADAYREAAPEIPDPSSSLGGVLLSPADRWDSGWFVRIAQDGYDSGLARSAFFPLYPLLIWIVAAPLGLLLDDPYRWAGVLISLGALLATLHLLHRLTALELGPQAADYTVLLLAFFPVSLYLSAIYSESLFLLLSVGCFYLARRRRWWAAAALGGLAAATRSQGVLLLIPLAIMLLWEPRRPGWKPQAPTLSQAGALLLVPLGLVAYFSYVRVTTSYGFLAPIESQSEWMREFKGPVVGAWGGVKNGLVSARDVVTGASMTDTVSGVRSGLLNFAALALGVVGVVGALRRLPLAYGTYALAGLVFLLSSPANDLQLKSLPRLSIVLFPIFMWAGWELQRWRHRTALLALSAAGLACCSAAYAAGYWIA
jgi:hypothetical protein